MINIKSQEKILNPVRWLHQRRIYRLLNELIARPLSETYSSDVDITPLPDGNERVLVLTIAFNNDAILRHQIEFMRSFWHDADMEYLIADNSPSEERRSAIRNLCRELGVPYILLPQDERINRVSASYSHGAAATWLYYNYVKVHNPRYFGFLDHDLFPIKPFSIVEKMAGGYAYGFKEQRGSAWYIWPGLLFLDMNFVKGREINLLPCCVADATSASGVAAVAGVAGGGSSLSGAGASVASAGLGGARGRFGGGKVYLDTGGSLWYTLYRDAGEEGCHAVGRKRIPVYVSGEKHRDPVDYVDDCWMHTNNGSNWKGIDDKQDILTKIWERYSDKLPDEIRL